MFSVHHCAARLFSSAPFLGDESSHFGNHQCGHVSRSTFYKMANLLILHRLAVFLSSSHFLTVCRCHHSWPWSPLSSPLSSHDCFTPFAVLVCWGSYPSVPHCWLHPWCTHLLSCQASSRPISQTVCLTSALCLPGNRQTNGNERSGCGRTETVWPGHPVHYPERRDHR